MQDIWPQLKTWIENDTPFAIATVVEATRPSPRGIGSVLAVRADGGAFIGSVSAGCVENEVIEAAKATMLDGEIRWLSFGPDSGFPWEVSLSCGGRIKVRVEPFAGLGDRYVGDRLSKLLDSQGRGLLLSYRGDHALIEEGQIWVGDPSGIPSELIAMAKERFQNGGATVEIEWEGKPALFRVLDRPKRLFVIGAAHIAIHIVGFARALGFETIVIDPRDAYARADRFPNQPDRLLREWPKQALEGFKISATDCVAAVTHDPKIDDQALGVFLRSDSQYIGALGSRKSHQARLKRLRRIGFDDSTLERIHGPIGLDIGSETPAEIALSVIAEIVKSNRGRKG